VPAIVEGLTGVDVNQMIQDIPGVRQNGAGNAEGEEVHAGTPVPVTSSVRNDQYPKRKNVASAESVDR
jgi:hypothetical protein